MTYSLATQEWLTTGGDQRIALDPSGANVYGCPPAPARDMLAYGSVTASVISPAGFFAADRLRRRLPDIASPAAYRDELQRMRREIITLCGLQGTPVDIIFAASGTDLHLLVAQLAVPSLIIMSEAGETGSGVPLALSGRHFSACTAMGETVMPGEAIYGAKAIEIAAIKSRHADGSPCSIAAIDVEAEKLASEAIAAGQRVLLVVTDVSKTGMVAPSPRCALTLQQRFPSMIEVLIDACQFRLAPSTLRAYLEQGFPVAITGSKFMTGPAFSSALLVPQIVAERWHDRILPPALGAYSARADWPEGWKATHILPDAANYGLLLRWEAALTEWRRFNALPETAVTECVENFALAIGSRLADNPVFTPLAAGTPGHHPIVAAPSWDRFPTIFSFLLRHSDGTWLSREETKQVYEQLRKEGCQLGQPVACGIRDGIPVSALRLALSARLIADAISPQARGSGAMIAEAMSALDKVSELIREPSVSSL